MTVANILKSKGTSKVHTIGPEATVQDASARLSQHRIGSLVVSSDQRNALGILSERDIVRELGRRGSGCLSETVAELMTKKLVTARPQDRVDDVLAKMTAGRFRHMPVVDDGGMIGLITLGDVVKFRLEEVKMEKDALEGMIMGH